MILSLTLEELNQYVYKQMENLFPDGKGCDILNYRREANDAIERMENCFKKVKKSSYNDGSQTYFSHLHSDQYTTFLWLLSNSIWKSRADSNICNKLFYMNKALNGFSCMYDTALPEYFLLLHTVGAVLGKAEYSNYLIATQGATVGAHHGIYPKLGEYVSLMPYSSIVGDCNIGKEISIGIGARVYNMDINDNTVVFIDDNGKTNYRFKEQSWAKQWFV